MGLKKDRAFVVLASVVFFSALVIALWDFLELQGMAFHLDFVNAIGTVLFVIGVSIRAVGRKTLGKFYSHGLKTTPDQQLIKHGIYKHIRHPISLVAIMYGLGIPLILSRVIGFLVMLGLIPLILYRKRIEERMLVERFGSEYLEYAQKTKKLVPFVY